MYEAYEHEPIEEMRERLLLLSRSMSKAAKENDPSYRNHAEGYWKLRSTYFYALYIDKRLER